MIEYKKQLLLNILTWSVGHSHLRSGKQCQILEVFIIYLYTHVIRNLTNGHVQCGISETVQRLFKPPHPIEDTSGAGYSKITRSDMVEIFNAWTNGGFDMNLLAIYQAYSFNSITFVASGACFKTFTFYAQDLFL